VEVTLHRKLLIPGKPVYIEHRGEMLRLHPADLTGNAHAKRAKFEEESEPSSSSPAITSAAESSFVARLRPLVDEMGGCAKGDQDD
jgi:hypothetical protein